MTLDTQRFNFADLTTRFEQLFGESHTDIQAFFAPGRVNLVGDHTDYTGGFVFPCAIDTGTLLLVRPNTKSQFRFASTNFDTVSELDESSISQPQGNDWVNYPLGVIDQFKKRGFSIDGIDCLYSGNVPNGAGLSSSASIEVVSAFALNTLFNCGLSLVELVKLSQAAENEFVGMQCGIMDQFAVAMAQQDHAMFLHCESLEYRQVPLRLGDHSIVLANSNQRRELNDSAYNERVSECKRALILLKTTLSINTLADVSTNDLSANKRLFKDDEIAYLRALHVASENERVKAAIPALEAGDLPAIGNIMNASHDSLRDAYHVSSEPLDFLVNTARNQSGVLGSRLTGAGFGGCIVNIVHNDHQAKFIDELGKAYEQHANVKADFYVIKPSDGVRQVSARGDS